MKRLLMLSLLLSVAALQAIREGEPHPGMHRPARLPGRGPTTSGVSGTAIHHGGPTTSGEQMTSVTEAEAADTVKRPHRRPTRAAATTKARTLRHRAQ